jgi:Meiotically up-regulated gene 113
LGDAPIIPLTANEELDDETLLEELGGIGTNSDITKLTHVRPRAEINAAEEIANRTPCNDFSKFKPLFDEVAEDIARGKRTTLQIRKDAGFLKARIKEDEFFILNGQTVYIAEVGETIKAPNGDTDARLRVIYSNGTESNLLLRSLQRALYKDESSRIISEPPAGPLFSGESEDSDVETGTIYVLRSESDHPQISENREFSHKIGVTGGDVKKRIGNPKVSSTYLMADVEIVATYELSNINPVKLENLIHRFFKPAQLNIKIKDRLGNPIDPREWFLVPLFVIDQMIEKIKDGSIVNCTYDVSKQEIRETK